MEAGAGWLAVVCVVAVGCGSAASQRPRAEAPLPPSGIERAIALYRQGAFAEAEAELTRVTSSRPQDATAWAYLGLSRVKLDRFSEGEAALRRALELDGEHAEAHYGMGLVHARAGRLDDAVAELERAVRSNPSHGYAHYHLGLAYHEKGRKDLAILHLQRFLALEPNAPEAERVRSLLEGLGTRSDGGLVFRF